MDDDTFNQYLAVIKDNTDLATFLFSSAGANNTIAELSVNTKRCQVLRLALRSTKISH